MTFASRISFWLVALLFPILAQAQSAIVPPAPQDDAGYAGAFHCPEAYASAADRRAADLAFFQWAEQTHPQWRVDDTLQYRQSLMRANNCETSLQESVGNEPLQGQNH